MRGSQVTYSLHCSSFVGPPFRILNVELVKPKQGTTMETIGSLPVYGIAAFLRSVLKLEQGGPCGGVGNMLQMLCEHMKILPPRAREQTPKTILTLRTL